jgi:ribosomal protein uS7
VPLPRPLPPDPTWLFALTHPRSAPLPFVHPRAPQVYVPHTAGRYQVKRFRKAQCPIVERLINALMRKARNNGKKFLGMKIVQQALEIVHLMTDENPLQVLVRAVVNAGPREDSTRIGAGGIVRRQAVGRVSFPSCEPGALSARYWRARGLFPHD